MSRKTYTIFGFEQANSAVIKKQSRYSNRPWHPGEIPAGVGSLQSVHGCLDDKPMPYGEFWGVQKPTADAQEYSPIKIVDSEGNETKWRQRGGKS